MPLTQVIVADDDGEIRSLLAEYLTERGFRVREAADGVDALKLIERTPLASALITDMRMPRMAGQELIEKALLVRPELKVAILTGYPNELPTGEALKAREIRV